MLQIKYFGAFAPSLEVVYEIIKAIIQVPEKTTKEK